MSFRGGTGDWTDYRSKLGLAPTDEVDLHFGRRDPRESSYENNMAAIRELIAKSLEKAQSEGRRYVMFTHGWSTSRPGKVTARSVLRRFMRSTEASRFIERKHCIQHEAMFVAKIRQP